jgi:hypothetical protein
MLSTAKKSAFRRVPFEGRLQLVKELPCGGKVVKRYPRVDDDGAPLDRFEAYDAKGRYLGSAPLLGSAEAMAFTGRVSFLSNCSELNLWALWNDAIESEEDFYKDEEGTEYLCLGGQTAMGAGIVLAARWGPGGPRVRFLATSDSRISGECGHFYNLTYLDKPTRLE